MEHEGQSKSDGTRGGPKAEGTSRKRKFDGTSRPHGTRGGRKSDGMREGRGLTEHATSQRLMELVGGPGVMENLTALLVWT